MADKISKQDLLNSLNDAIYTIAVGGQSYKIGSRSLTRADLKQIYAIKNDIEAQISRENAGANGLLDDCYVSFFDGR